MIVLVATGAGIGAVLVALIWWLIPPVTSPVITLGRYDAYLRSSGQVELIGTPTAPGQNTDAGWQVRVGRKVTAQLERRGISHSSLRQDLALTGRTYENVMSRKVVAFVAGFLLAALAVSVLQVRSLLPLPVGSPAVLALLVGGGFFVLPDLEARSEATARRRDFRRALGAYLDLVALEMAGSAAPAEALPSAARVGHGWPLALLRDTLYQASLAGRSHWLALSELGERIGVPELRDLGELVRLVGQDGAQIRQTLSARAATMRSRELSDAEGDAGERDQSMLMAQLLVGFAFVLFVGYPAVAAVMTL
jgi:Flp pilus assembly protein TadB